MVKAIEPTEDGDQGNEESLFPDVADPYAAHMAAPLTPEELDLVEQWCRTYDPRLEVMAHSWLGRLVAEVRRRRREDGG